MKSLIHFSASTVSLFVGLEREKQMRYYLPLHEKNIQGKDHQPSRTIPLWVWIAVIALLLLVVLALR